MDAFTLVAKLTLNDTEFQTKLKQAEASAEGGAKSASKWGVMFGNLAANAVMKTARALKNFGVSVVRTGMDFDATMSQVKALGQLQGQAFDDVRQRAIELGRTTKFTSTEVGEAFSYMALAGWNSEEMLAGIAGVLDLAAASGENLGRTSDIVTDAITAFGLSASDTQHFVDVLAQASANSNTTVGMMGEAFKYVGNVAGTLGYSIDDVAVALGLMANTGIKASQAGTSMRQILNTLIAPTDGAAEAMKELGLSLFEAGSGKAKPFMQVMQELRGVFKDSGYNIEGSSEALDEFITKQAELEEMLSNGQMTEEEYTNQLNALMQNNPNQQFLAQLSAIGGMRGIGSLLAIMKASDKDFEELVNSVANSSGAAQTMAQTMIDNLQGDITLLNSALDGMKILLNDNFKTGIREFIQMLTTEIGELSKAFEQGGVAGMFTNIVDWMVNGITNALSDPSITVEGANDFGKALGDFIGHLVGTLVANAPEIMAGLFTAGVNLADGIIQGLFAGLFGTGAGSVPGLINQLADEENDAIKQAEETSVKATGIVGYMDSLVQKYGDAAEGTTEWAAGLSELERLLPGITEYIKQQGQETATATEAMKEYAENTRQAAIEDAKRQTLSGLSNEYVSASQKYYEAEIRRDMAQEQKGAAWEALLKYAGISGDFTGDIDQLAFAARSMANELGEDQTYVNALVDAYNEAEKTIQSENESMASLNEKMITLSAELDIATAALERMASAASGAAGSASTGMNSGEYYNWYYGGQHAAGQWNVPYDSYNLLHRGEMVLSESQARAYRGGSGVDVSAITEAVAAAVRAGMQDVTVKSYLSGRDVTDDVNRNTARMLKARRFAT